MDDLLESGDQLPCLMEDAEKENALTGREVDTRESGGYVSNAVYRTWNASWRHLPKRERMEISTALKMGAALGDVRYKDLCLTGDAKTARILIDQYSLDSAFIQGWSAGMCSLLAVASVLQCRWLEFDPDGALYCFIPVYP